MIGKRKREFAVASHQTARDAQEDQNGGLDDSSVRDQDVFRRHFEAAFEPLPDVENEVPQDDKELEGLPSQSDAEESDWEGLSDAGEQTPEVQVVEHKEASVHRDDDDDDPDSVELQRLRYKQFMVSFLLPRTCPPSGC